MSWVFLAGVLTLSPPALTCAMGDSWLEGYEFESLVGDWRLGPNFQIGVGPDYIIDPSELSGVGLSIDFDGYRLTGFDGGSWRCDGMKVDVIADTTPGTVRNLLYVPEELRFDWVNKASIGLSCRDLSLYEVDPTSSLFRASFNFYYSDDGVVHTYEPQHGPEFILVPDTGDSR